MMIYRRETQSNAKWLVAAIIFIVAMTFTIDQAFGSPTPPRRHDSRNENHHGSSHQNNHYSDNEYNKPEWHEEDHGGNTDPAPSAVPEPATIILLGLGLASAGAVRRKAN